MGGFKVICDGLRLRLQYKKSTRKIRTSAGRAAIAAQRIKKMSMELRPDEISSIIKDQLKKL